MKDYLGLAEVAEEAGVSRQAVVNWRTRYKDFPPPIAELMSGPIWRREDVERWLKNREGKMATVISFINLKGGVGKTTSVVALAEFLSDLNEKKVLVVDLDPQTNATTTLISQDLWEEKDKKRQTLRQLFKDKLENTDKFNINDAIVKGVSNLHGGIPGLDLLPSSLGLIDIQDQLALIPGGTYYAVSPVTILATALKPVLEQYDYVLIDCPPNLGIITLNGIYMSNGFIIPTIPDILSTYGLPQILNRIEEFSKVTKIAVPCKGIIITMFRTQSKLHKSKLEQLRKDAQSGELPPVFDTVIPTATQIGESADVEASVNTLRQKYGYGGNFEIYSALAKEFLAKC